jgi:hypothetical protein
MYLIASSTVNSGRRHTKRGFHQAAGDILRVGQQSLHFIACGGLEQLQQSVALLDGSRLHKIGCVVQRQHPHQPQPFGRR